MEHQSFWLRHEAALVGIIGGVLIAILAAYLTFFLSKRQQYQKEKQTYQGLLYVLHTELYWHNHQLNMTRKTLNEFSNIQVRLDNPVPTFDLELTNQILLQLIEYKRFDPEIAAFTDSYTNIINYLNFSLDFKNAYQLIQQGELSKSELKLYISKVDEYITKAQISISNIQIILQKELSHLPKEKTLFEAFFKENTHNKR